MKSGIIVSHTNEYIIVMTKFLEYYKLRKDGNPEIGETVYFLEDMIIKEKRKFHMYNYAAVAALFVMLILSVIVIANNVNANDYGMLSIQINPEINIVFDEKLELTELVYLNDDAKAIVVDESEKLLVPVVESIVSQLSSLGYFDDSAHELRMIYGSSKKMVGLEEEISSMVSIIESDYPEINVSVSRIPGEVFKDFDKDKPLIDQIELLETELEGFLGGVGNESEKVEDGSLDADVDTDVDVGDGSSGGVDGSLDVEDDSETDTEIDSNVDVNVDVDVDVNVDVDVDVNTDVDVDANVDSNTDSNTETITDLETGENKDNDNNKDKDKETGSDKKDEDVHGSENAGENSNPASNGGDSSQNANDASTGKKDKEKDKDKD